MLRSSRRVCVAEVKGGVGERLDKGNIETSSRLSDSLSFSNAALMPENL